MQFRSWMPKMTYSKAVVLAISLAVFVIGISSSEPFTSKASAYGPSNPHTPVRIVLLLAQDGGDANSLGRAEETGRAVRDWYCLKVGSCYDYQGVSIMTGSLTMAQYAACPPGLNCTADNSPATAQNPADPLLAMMFNIQSSQDDNVINRPDVDTLVVPSWPIQTTFSCGRGIVGGTLALIAPFASTQCALPGAALAHELGHNFGLEHTNDGTLMTGVPFSQTAPYCDITSDPATSLLNGGPGVCELNANQVTQLKATTTYFGTVDNSDPTKRPVTLTQQQIELLRQQAEKRCVRLMINSSSLAKKLEACEYGYLFKSLYNNDVRIACKEKYKNSKLKEACYEGGGIKKASKKVTKKPTKKPAKKPAKSAASAEASSAPRRSGSTPIEVGSLPRVNADSTTISTILSIAFGIIGAIALLMITAAGLRYIASAGDPQKTANAKSTIIYALVGLVIAISAEAIIAFVVKRL